MRGSSLAWPASLDKLRPFIVTYWSGRTADDAPPEVGAVIDAASYRDKHINFALFALDADGKLLRSMIPTVRPGELAFNPETQGRAFRKQLDEMLDGLKLQTVTAADPPIAVTVVQLAQDGTPLAMRRYSFDPVGHFWQGHIFPATAPAVTDPVMSVDLNNSGTYEAGEQIPPTHTSGAGAVDTTDNVSGNPLIRYTINDGPAQTYPGPLSVGPAQNVVLKAFAEDAMGNTSGLITTNVRPVLSANKQGGNAIVLSWPVADAYVLEETVDLLNPWSPSSVQINRSTYTESATVPIGTVPRKFFRLRSQAITK